MWQLLRETQNVSIKSGKFPCERKITMSDLKPTAGKHLTLDERQEIMESLDRGMAFKDIARWIRKAPTTISREVKSISLSNLFRSSA